MTTVDSLHEQWLDAYSDQIGRARDEVTTPALLLDLDKAKRNIATMAAKFRELPAELRPHVKVHKSPQLARLEVESGAVGVACATAWEALVMAQARDRRRADREPGRPSRQGACDDGCRAADAAHGRG